MGLYYCCNCRAQRRYSALDAIKHRLRAKYLENEQSRLESIRGDLSNAFDDLENVPGNGSSFASEVKRYFVDGTIDGARVKALPDNGASLCFISKSLVSRLDLQPKPQTQRSIYLANKKLIHSPGMVEIPWTFEGEKTEYLLKCWILQESAHDLILGSPFLRATQTLTRYVLRIKYEVISLPKRMRLHLLGNESQRLWGYLDNNYTAAFPDTGSDAMLISRAYAEKLALEIDTNTKNQVELGDRTVAWTSGIVRDVPWEVGETVIQCDFHVLDNLCVDVVLSNDYLFKFKIFSEYTEYLDDDGTEDDLSQLCNIRLIGQYGESLDLLEEDYLVDVNGPDAFEPEKVQRELARRDFIRDAISALPEDQQDAVRLSEMERQSRWESLRKAHRASRPQSPASQQRQKPTSRLSIPTITRLTSDKNKMQVKVALRTWWKRRTGVFTTSSPLQSNNIAS